MEFTTSAHSAYNAKDASTDPVAGPRRIQTTHAVRGSHAADEMADLRSARIALQAKA